MGSAASRACTLALLTAADAVFLWMFLSTDPLTQLAAEFRKTCAATAVAALGFGADWRHGMAANSWVYMPGFFVTAAALWLHARHAPPARAHLERTVAGLVALLSALDGATMGSAVVVQAFVETSGILPPGVLPAPSAAGTFSGVYTLVTWSVFVLASRRALVQRTFRPFLTPAILSVGLVVVRPWTVDDFTSRWAAEAASGSAPALGSVALVFMLAALLVAAERQSAKPQPREATLHDSEAARPEDQEQVSADSDQIEAR